MKKTALIERTLVFEPRGMDFNYLGTTPKEYENLFFKNFRYYFEGKDALGVGFMGEFRISTPADEQTAKNWGVSMGRAVGFIEFSYYNHEGCCRRGTFYNPYPGGMGKVEPTKESVLQKIYEETGTRYDDIILD